MFRRSMIIDLTKPMDTSFLPYSTGVYTDPSLEFNEWSSIAEEGFRVTRLSLGTQSGTHIDAPAHFMEEGAKLEDLLPDHLIGRYFLLNLPCTALSSDEKILFLRTPENLSTKIPGEAMQKILSLPPFLLVLAGAIEIQDAEPFTFNRLVAGAAKYLVEDLDQKEAHRIPGVGEMFIGPLRLAGVSGSPCRVLVRAMETEMTGSTV